MSRSKLKHGFKQNAENKSLELRKINSKQDHERLSAKQLAEYLEVTLLYPKDIVGIPATILKSLCNLDSKWSAVTLEINGHIVVILNPAHSDYRIESNIFHELAHLICKHEMKGFKKLNGLPLRDFDTEQEAEAEWLGGCLHIPRKGLEWALRNNMNKESISKYYNASLQMVDFRINRTGIKYQYKYNGRV